MSNCFLEFSATRTSTSLLLLTILDYRKMPVLALIFGLGVGAAAHAAPPASADTAHAEGPAPRSASSYSKLPLSFEANQGQADAEVKFLSRGDGYSLFLTSNAAVLKLRHAASASTVAPVLNMELLDASKDAQISGTEQLPGVSNYIIGNDPKKWHTDVPTFAKVQYRDIYPGIDAVFYGNQRQLEYDFVVAPGADAGRIALNLAGVQPKLNADGDVALGLGGKGLHGEDLLLRKPVVYQGTGSDRKMIRASYEIAGSKVSFHLGKYDHSRPLIIDPTFTYLTYLGGSGNDYVGTGVPQYGGITPSGSLLSNALAIDSAGNVYVAGATSSVDFPTLNGYHETRTDGGGGDWSGYVSKLNSTGTALIYSTYLGGTESDNIAAITVDSAGDAYVVGWSNSKDYPTTAGAYQTAYRSQQQGFVTKLNSAGDALVYSTLLGGTAYSEAYGIAVDANGLAYISGNIAGGGGDGSVTSFPLTSDALPLPTDAFAGSGFVSVLDAAGANLLYSTAIGDIQGGNNETTAQGIAVDASGNFYVTGASQSPALPVTSTAFQTTLGTNNATPTAAFVAKFGAVKAGATPLTYLTYLRATGLDYQDWGGAITADASGNAYVTGYTASPTFPTTTGAYQPTCIMNGANACFTSFVTKVNPSGTALVWSTMLGNSINEYVSSIVLDTTGNIYVTGSSGFGTFSGGGSYFPILNPVQTNDQGSAAFIAELDPTGSTLLFGSPVGDPASTTVGTGLAVDASGNIYLGGYTYFGTGMPVTDGAFQTTFGGGIDGFIAKISLATPDLTVAKSHSGSFALGQTGATYTITTSNAGAAPTTGDVTVTESVPTGLTLTAMAGAGWTCTTLPTCTRSDVLAASASYPPITATVNVANNAAATVVNMATVSGGGESNVSNDSASDPTIITATGGLLTATVALTPASSTIDTGSSLSVVANVTGAGTTPTGTVTLSSGSYTSSAGTLAAGSFTFAIPADSLVAGSDTLTLMYSGDTNYAAGVSTAAVTVTASVYTLAATSPSPVAAGATATSTVTVATTTDYAGTVTLACSLTTSPSGATDLPTCSVGGGAVALSSTASSGTAAVTVSSTAATTALLAQPVSNQKPARGWLPAGGTALACLMFLVRPRRLRKWQSLFRLLLMMIAIGSLSGCGGGSKSSGGGGGSGSTGTTSGTYTFTITGTGSPSITSSPTTTFTVMIN